MSEVRHTIQDRGQLPEGLDWLTPDERARYNRFRFDKRRRDWLLGRWTAKNVLLQLAGFPERDIGRFEISSAPDGAPLARLDSKPYEARLSISHSNGRAFCAVSPGMIELGCDIELVEPRSDAFVETFFTDSERARVENAEEQNRDLLVTMIWSAKESTLKALRTGLRVDTRNVEVVGASNLEVDDWKSGRTFAADAGEFCCQWRLDDQFVLSIATRA